MIHTDSSFAVDHLGDALLDVGSQLRPMVRRFDAQCAGQAAVQVEPAEVGSGLIDDLVAVRIESVAKAA